MERSWTEMGCERPEAVSAFVGHPIKTASAELGDPISRERFGLADGMNEFRIELRNVLPLPANSATQVEERTWAKGDCRLTLWSVERDGDWRVIHAMRWPAGAEF